MIRLPIIADNQRPDLCGPCGGHCCKRVPGAYFPSDFGATEDEIRAAVRAEIIAGRVALSDYDDDPIVIPAIQGRCGTVQLSHPKFDSPCANLGAAGCLLPFERRPTQCRALAPDPTTAGGKGCKLPREVDNDVCRIAWTPYRDLFEELT